MCIGDSFHCYGALYSTWAGLSWLVGHHLRLTLEKKGGGAGSEVRMSFLQSARASCTIALCDRERLLFNFRRERTCFELKTRKNNIY